MSNAKYEKCIKNTGHKICRKRKLGTPRRAWEDNITKDAQEIQENDCHLLGVLLLVAMDAEFVNQQQYCPFRR